MFLFKTSFPGGGGVGGEWGGWGVGGQGEGWEGGDGQQAKGYEVSQGLGDQNGHLFTQA